MGRMITMVAFAALAATIALAADVPGSRDPAFLKRYAGSEIVLSVTHNYDSYTVYVPDEKDRSKPATENREGTVQRLVYRVPPGHGALEILRNYEQAVKAAGFSIAYEMLPCEPRWDWDFTIFKLVRGTGLEDKRLPSVFSHVSGGTDGPFCFFTATGRPKGQDVALTVAVDEKQDRRDPANYTFQFGSSPSPVVFKPGELVAMVDVVTSKAVVNNMVTVTAADMADALATKGAISLYGIYFDVDRAAIKPESGKTLDEIANLLKIDRSLKLEVAGHTDKTGSPDHNMKLSEARAQAVVGALVNKYGIAAARLRAKGYGDTKPVAPNDNEANRAKNRRVELKKL